ncbi:MAG: hypothetical protein CMF72_12330 [Mameliella sp.]|nr:hypothetical protein [Mameliella sp.]
MEILKALGDPRVIAGALAGTITLSGVIFGVLMNYRAARLKLDLERASNKLSELKFQSDETHKQAIMAIEKSNSMAKLIADELTSIRDAASRLLSALEILASGHQISEQTKIEAIRSASFLSLLLPPNSTFKEELGNQLDVSGMILLGIDQPELKKHVTAMRMNVWRLVNAKMNDLAAHSGYKEGSLENLSPYAAKHVV